MKGFYKGPLVWDDKRIYRAVNDDGRYANSGFCRDGPAKGTRRILAVYNERIYDLSDYIQTYNDNNGSGGYDYLDADIVALFKQQPGQDITEEADAIFENMTERNRVANKACLNNRFMYGQTDFRKTARCTVQGYMLVVASALIASTILIKCMSLSSSAFETELTFS